MMHHTVERRLALKAHAATSPASAALQQPAAVIWQCYLQHTYTKCEYAIWGSCRAACSPPALLLLLTAASVAAAALLSSLWLSTSLLMLLLLQLYGPASAPCCPTSYTSSCCQGVTGVCRYCKRDLGAAATQQQQQDTNFINFYDTTCSLSLAALAATYPYTAS
jgi:hypothetical protein